MSKQIIIPRDFEDDDEDSYVTQHDPQLTDEELSDLPINLASLDISKFPLKFKTPKEWKEIVQLIDPLHLPAVYNVLSLCLTHSWEYEDKNTEDKSKLSANPQICVEVLPNSTLHEYFLFPVTEVITNQIFPLFGILVMKSHRKIGYERFEYRLRLGAKPLRIHDVLRLMSDINLIFNAQDAIAPEEIASRLFLGLLTTMLERHRSIPAPIRLLNGDDDDVDDDDDNDDARDSEVHIQCQKDHQTLIQRDFNNLWFEMSNFQIDISYSNKFTLPLPTPPPSTDPTSHLFTRPKIFNVDFTQFHQLSHHFSKRQEELYCDVLNSVVINYERPTISFSIPCVDYAIPAALPATTVRASFEKSAPSGPSSIKQVPLLHLDLFLILPNVLITVIKAIITFKIRQANTDLQAWQVNDMQEMMHDDDTGDKSVGCNERKEVQDKKKLNTAKLMKKETIFKYLELFKVLAEQKQHYSPGDILSCWASLTERAGEEFGPNNASKQTSLSSSSVDIESQPLNSLAAQFNKLILENTPTYILAPGADTTQEQVQKEEQQSEVEADNVADTEAKPSTPQPPPTPHAMTDLAPSNTTEPTTTTTPQEQEQEQKPASISESPATQMDDLTDGDGVVDPCDHLAQSISLSLAQQYIFHGFAITSRQFSIRTLPK